MLALGSEYGVKTNGVADSHSSFQHQLQEEPERLGTPGVSARTAAEFQGFVQDLLDVLIRIRLLLILYGAMSLHPVH